jgi:hypothetical protein
VARRLSGSAGLVGVDSQVVSHWLLAYGNFSETLGHPPASFSMWMGNSLPPWAAYWALLSGILMALEKMPGVGLIGIVETWRRAIAKLILLMTDREVAAACKTERLCAGLQGGIKATIHTMRATWESHHMQEKWGLLLTDAKNAFNEMDQTVLPKGIAAESDGHADVAVNIRCVNGCDDSGWGRFELVHRKRQ